jgi:glycosyltransferase involved in cell wall biosynthesis
VRVLLVHSRYRSNAPSGENNVVDQEAAALTAAGHEVMLFERNSDDIAGWSLPRKAMLPVQSLWNRQVQVDLRQRLSQWRPDVVHVHNTFPLITPSMLYACRDAGVPVVATIHNYKLSCASGVFFRDGKLCHDCAGGSGLPGIRHGCYRDSRAATAAVVAATDLHRRSWRELVSAYIFISASQRDLLSDLGLPGERVFVKHNFVPAVTAGQGQRDHQVAYLGRLDEAKGAPFLMRAWDEFRARAPQARLRLAVAGGGPLADDVRVWGETRPSVDVLGLLSRPEASALLARSLAAVVPSQWQETFGLVAVEAMAAGVAPVAPSRGSFPEFVIPGVNGALFDAEDPSALAGVLADIDQHPDRYIAYGHQGRVTVEQDFSPGRSVERLLEVYRFAVSNPANTVRTDR